MSAPGPAPSTPLGVRLVLLGVSCLVSLVVAELMLRLVWPQTLGLSWQTDAGPYVHVPGLESVYQRSEFEVPVRFNSLGLRGPEVAIPKPAGTFRVLALGDSFTEGAQVLEEDLFTSRIAAAFESEAPRVEVVNGGVSGYGTSDALALLDLYGPRLEPDLVILFFCVQNDTMNDVMLGRCRVEAGRVTCDPAPRREGLALRVNRLKSFLGSRLHLYQLVRGGTANLGLDRIGVRAVAPPEGTEAMPFKNDKYWEPLPPYLASGLDLSTALVGAVRDRARSLGAETWVVLVPAREQVQGADWGRIVEEEQGRTLVRDQLQRRLAAGIGALGIPVIDPMPAFRARADSGESLYWEIDAHFGPKGHEAVAGQVVSALRARGIPPAAARSNAPRGSSAGTTATD